MCVCVVIGFADQSKKKELKLAIKVAFYNMRARHLTVIILLKSHFVLVNVII